MAVQNLQVVVQKMQVKRARFGRSPFYLRAPLIDGNPLNAGPFQGPLGSMEPGSGDTKEALASGDFKIPV